MGTRSNDEVPGDDRRSGVGSPADKKPDPIVPKSISPSQRRRRTLWPASTDDKETDADEGDANIGDEVIDVHQSVLSQSTHVVDCWASAAATAEGLVHNDQVSPRRFVPVAWRPWRLIDAARVPWAARMSGPIVLSPEARQVADRLARLRHQFDLYRLLTPGPRDEVEAQQRRFFQDRASGRRYNPVFRYPAAEHANSAERTELEAELSWLESEQYAGAEDYPWWALLEEDRATLVGHLHMVMNIGNDAEFTRWTHATFPPPTPADVAAARAFLANVPPDRQFEGEPPQTDELAKMARAYLDQRGLQSWEVVVQSDQISRLKVDTAARRVELRANTRFDHLDVVSLLYHEIEGHAVRADNGLKHGHELLATGVGMEIECDEGVAVYLEATNGGMTGRRAEEVAARVVAVDLGTRLPFAEVFDQIVALTPSLSEELRFLLVARAKRGLTDTANPGGWTKDAYYFSGYWKVKTMMEQSADPAATWKRLMNARVSWHGLAAADKLAEQRAET